MAFDLARAKRAINRCQFDEAETILLEILAGVPESIEADELLKRLQRLKDEESRGSYRILRDWFPGGNTGRR